jgi:hypothetical protein
MTHSDEIVSDTRSLYFIRLLPRYTEAIPLLASNTSLLFLDMTYLK